MEDRITKRLQPRDYTGTLEKRVAYLESVLQQRYQNSPDNVSFSFEGFVEQPEIQPNASVEMPALSSEWGTQASEFKPNSKNDEFNDLASKVGTLSINAGGAEPRYLGTSSIFAFSRVINSSLRQVVSRAPSIVPEQYDSDWPNPTPCMLPDYQSATKLSDAYFENIHPQYPFLHEPTFRSWEMMLATSSQESDNFNFNPSCLFFLNMVGY